MLLLASKACAVAQETLAMWCSLASWLRVCAVKALWTLNPLFCCFYMWVFSLASPIGCKPAHIVKKVDGVSGIACRSSLKWSIFLKKSTWAERILVCALLQPQTFHQLRAELAAIWSPHKDWRHLWRITKWAKWHALWYGEQLEQELEWKHGPEDDEEQVEHTLQGEHHAFFHSPNVYCMWKWTLFLVCHIFLSHIPCQLQRCFSHLMFWNHMMQHQASILSSAFLAHFQIGYLVGNLFMTFIA